MYIRTVSLCLVILIILSGCTATETIGDYRYNIKMERANTGDFGGIIVTIKSYYLRNELQGGCIVKSQRIGSEQPSDTIFSRGFTFIDQNTNELKCFEFNFYGYKDYKNDTYRSFTQTKDGKLKLNQIKTIKMEDGKNKLWETTNPNP